MLQAIAAIVTLALAIGLHQDFFSWPTDVALFFAASLLGLVMTFPSHFLTSSEDFLKSKRKNMYFLLAAFIQFSGFGLCLAAFIYGLATNQNGKCEADGYYFCVVFRIALAFDLLLGLLQLAGVICIGLSMRPPKAHADHY